MLYIKLINHFLNSCVITLNDIYYTREGVSFSQNQNNINYFFIKFIFIKITIFIKWLILNENFLSLTSTYSHFTIFIFSNWIFLMKYILGGLKNILLFLKLLNNFLIFCVFFFNNKYCEPKVVLARKYGKLFT